MLSGHELVKRVRDDVFRAAACEDEDDAIPTSPYFSSVEERLQARPQRLLLSVRNDALEEALDLRRARDAVDLAVLRVREPQLEAAGVVGRVEDVC